MDHADHMHASLLRELDAIEAEGKKNERRPKTRRVRKVVIDTARYGPNAGKWFISLFYTRGPHRHIPGFETYEAATSYLKNSTAELEAA